MKKVTFIILTSAIYLIGCTTETTDDHGHDHGPNGEHIEEEAHGHDHVQEHEQESFVVENDSAIVQGIEEIEHDSSNVKNAEEIKHHDDHGHDHGDHDHQH